MAHAKTIIHLHLRRVAVDAATLGRLPGAADALRQALVETLGRGPVAGAPVAQGPPPNAAERTAGAVGRAAWSHPALGRALGQAAARKGR